jgi:hypothetical protein
MIWRFTLFINGLSEFTDEQADALYEAGCSDGSLASGDGRAWIGFDREADSLLAAVQSAIADIGQVGLEIDHVEIDHEEVAQWPAG